MVQSAISRIDLNSVVGNATNVLPDNGGTGPQYDDLLVSAAPHPALGPSLNAKLGDARPRCRSRSITPGARAITRSITALTT